MPDQTAEAQRLAQQRVRDLEQLAEERGRQSERVNGRIKWLESHAKEVNGQLVRLADTQDEMNKQLGAIVESLKVAEQVNARVERIAKATGTKRLNRWQVAGIIAGILLAAVSITLYLVDLASKVH